MPAGVIIRQNPPPGTTLDMGTYVHLTTSVGPPETGNAGEIQAPRHDPQPARPFQRSLRLGGSGLSRRRRSLRGYRSGQLQGGLLLLRAHLQKPTPPV